MGSKHLLLLRHAKSSWADPDVGDHDRPLNKRGQRDARLVGRHLRSLGVQPDLVLCSSATRTCQTLKLLHVASSVDVLIEDHLYCAEPSALLARLRHVPAAVRSVLLIGHNPGIEDLTRMLIGDGVVLAEKFPTGAMAELRLPIRTWKELDAGIARLRAFVIPRNLDEIPDTHQPDTHRGTHNHH
jgi:phosphohistidine phosphatase